MRPIQLKEKVSINCFEFTDSVESNTFTYGTISNVCNLSPSNKGVTQIFFEFKI